MYRFRLIAVFLLSQFLFAACSTEFPHKHALFADIPHNRPLFGPDPGPCVEKQINAPERSVYFDFDSYIVKDYFETMVIEHAKYIVAHPAAKIVI